MLTLEEKRQLAFAQRQFVKRHKFGFFARFDELTGVLACPGVRLRPLERTSFNQNYKKRMQKEILYDRSERINMEFE